MAQQEFKSLAAEYAKLGSQFEEQIKQYNVKQLVALHEKKIKESAQTKTSSSKRSAELEEFLKEVKKMVKTHEDRIKAGTISDQMVAEMKAHYAKLREQSDKLARELTTAATASTATVVGGTPQKGEVTVNGSSDASPGKVPPPLPPKNKKGGSAEGTGEGGAGSTGTGSAGKASGGSAVKIILAVLAVVLIGAGVALTVKPELLDLVITPPPKPASSSGIFGGKEEPKTESLVDKMKALANAKAEEERRKKEEEEAAQSMMMMVIGGTVVLGVVIAVVVMMSKSSGATGGEAATEDPEKKYGRYVKEKDDDGDVYSSHRLDRKS